MAQAPEEEQVQHTQDLHTTDTTDHTTGTTDTTTTTATATTTTTSSGSTWTERASHYGTKLQEGCQNLETKAKDRLKMEGLLKQARESLNSFLHPKLEIEKQIPVAVLRKAKGIVFLTVVKAGLGLGAEMGSGVVMARLSTGGWSPPLAIGAAGIKWGLQIGASKVDYIMVLFDNESVETFSGRGQLKLGGDANVSVGPYGRDADVGVAASEKAKIAPILSYAMAKGAYAGITLKGEVIAVRQDCNETFYGHKSTAQDILTDKVQMPQNEDWSAIGATLDLYVAEAEQHHSEHAGHAEHGEENGEQEETEHVAT